MFTKAAHRLQREAQFQHTESYSNESRDQTQQCRRGTDSLLKRA